MFDMKTIRPDICIALRMIALQEQWRKGQEFLEQMEKDYGKESKTQTVVEE